MQTRPSQCPCTRLQMYFPTRVFIFAYNSRELAWHISQLGFPNREYISISKENFCLYEVHTCLSLALFTLYHYCTSHCCMVFTALWRLLCSNAALSYSPSVLPLCATRQPFHSDFYCVYQTDWHDIAGHCDCSRNNLLH
jgi:hypothetical protein